MNRDEIRKVVEEELQRVLERDEQAVKPPVQIKEAAVTDGREGAPRVEEPALPEPAMKIARWLTDPQTRRAPPPTAEHDTPSSSRVPPVGTRKPTGVERPRNPEALQRFVAATPSRIGVGRAGIRYLTKTYVGLRADHAIAKDAVYSETKDGFAATLGCIELRSRCKDRERFLLYPGEGRRLDEASEQRLVAEGTKGAQVQVIFGDGLSAWAAEANGPALLPALQSELETAGFSVGRPVFVRFARVGVQDHIGVLLGAQATLICLGERPGLGSGDSLSIYLAYGPKLDQDNAEKNCISNVRALGILPAAAAKEAATILKRAFAAGRGGVQAK
ncbi:MAG TPA: ethanolamine ammonia-lyase subunit EutC [Myxococcales bacterium]